MLILRCGKGFGDFAPDQGLGVSRLSAVVPCLCPGISLKGSAVHALKSAAPIRSWKMVNEMSDEMVSGRDGLLPLSQRVDAPAELGLPDAGNGVRWRPLERADLDNVLALWHAVDPVDDPTSATTLEDLVEEFDDPVFDAERDGLVGLDGQGRAVACGRVTRSSVDETIVWIHLEGVVHPDRRGEGIGTTLLDWQERRGRQHLAASEDTLPGWLVADVSEHAVAAGELLTVNGFRGARWWFEMERDLSAPIPDVALPAGARVVGYTADLAEAGRLTFNEAFRDHWGSQPHTASEWAIADRRSEFRADLSSLVSVADGDEADEIVALLSSEVPEYEWEARGRKFASISAVAVRRPWRGRGIARALIVQAMRAYRDEGLELAVLSVDTENPSGALGLYEGLGFVPTERSTTFVKTF